MQESLMHKTDWSDVDDLNRFHRDETTLAAVREALDLGKEHPACKSCWFYESNYGSSMRTNSSTWSEDGEGIMFADIRLTNRCNLRCRMCFPGDSDQIANIVRELESRKISSPLAGYEMIDDPASIDNLLNRLMDLPRLKTIRLAGGEPFIMPEVRRLLSRLAEAGKTDVKIEIITNCTSADPRMLSILERFETVAITCSIDGVGETLEYQRYPSRWKTIETNFMCFYNSRFDLFISPCIGILNYLDLPSFFRWTRQFDVLVFYNEIQDPSFMNFRYIPEEVRSKFYESFSSMDLGKIDQRWQVFQEETMYESAIPTEDEKRLLSEYSTKIWDHRCKVRFLDRYPWAERLLK